MGVVRNDINGKRQYVNISTHFDNEQQLKTNVEEMSSVTSLKMSEALQNKLNGKFNSAEMNAFIKAFIFSKCS